MLKAVMGNNNILLPMTDAHRQRNGARTAASDWAFARLASWFVKKSEAISDALETSKIFTLRTRKFIMKRETRGSFNLKFEKRRAGAAALALAMTGALTLSAIVPVVADTKSKATVGGFTADQKIIH